MSFTGGCGIVGGPPPSHPQHVVQVILPRAGAREAYGVYPPVLVATVHRASVPVQHQRSVVVSAAPPASTLPAPPLGYVVGGSFSAQAPQQQLPGHPLASSPAVVHRPVCAASSPQRSYSSEIIVAHEAAGGDAEALRSEAELAGRMMYREVRKLQPRPEEATPSTTEQSFSPNSRCTESSMSSAAPDVVPPQPSRCYDSSGAAGYSEATLAPQSTGRQQAASSEQAAAPAVRTPRQVRQRQGTPRSSPSSTRAPRATEVTPPSTPQQKCRQIHNSSKGTPVAGICQRPASARPCRGRAQEGTEKPKPCSPVRERFPRSVSAQSTRRRDVQLSGGKAAEQQGCRAARREKVASSTGKPSDGGIARQGSEDVRGGRRAAAGRSACHGAVTGASKSAAAPNKCDDKECSQSVMEALDIAELLQEKLAAMPEHMRPTITRRFLSQCDLIYTPRAERAFQDGRALQGAPDKQPKSPRRLRAGA